jgi:hypothetical protein
MDPPADIRDRFPGQLVDNCLPVRTRLPTRRQAGKAVSADASPAPHRRTQPAQRIAHPQPHAGQIGGQKHEWIRMQVELQANFNPETKTATEDKAGKKAANKQWVDKIKVTVTQIFKPLAAKEASEFSYYRSTATILTMEVNSARSVYFYLPGDIVKRDRLKMQPDYFYVQLEVGGTEVPLYTEAGRLSADMQAAVHKQFVNKQTFDGARDLADRGVTANAGMLRPQYLVPYAIFDTVPQGSPSPEFLREDTASR